MKRHIAILGSTGSIGQQALEVITTHSDRFVVEVLTANNNVERLVEQAIRFQPNAVVIANKAHYSKLQEALEKHPIKVFAGTDALAQIVCMESIDVVLTAMVGYAGLLPTINAIKSRKIIALANKETLVVAGDLITRLAAQHKAPIYPVDSEHSALYQCLIGEDLNSIEKIILTASGGPFRQKTLQELRTVNKAAALKHPNWDMGAKITIDSATLMNKGLEAIEAKWLFNLQPDQIEVVVHSQSIIHSLVQFCDGSIKAQMGLPDMKLPIQYALSFPERLSSDFPRFSFADYPALHFEAPDTERFPNLAIALEAMVRGGNIPCAMNAANEVVVEAFLNDRIGFMAMPTVIERVIAQIDFQQSPGYEDYVSCDREARQIAKELLNHK